MHVMIAGIATACRSVDCKINSNAISLGDATSEISGELAANLRTKLMRQRYRIFAADTGVYPPLSGFGRIPQPGSIGGPFVCLRRKRFWNKYLAVLKSWRSPIVMRLIISIVGDLFTRNIG